jgi:hypothetical protein
VIFLKKLLHILISILFCFSLATWSVSAAKSTYTKEFSYLPSYSSNMELQSFTPPTQSTQGYGIAKYTIKNTNKNDVLLKYESILKKDGWTIYDDKKPYSIGAKKDTHQIGLVPTSTGKDVLLTVFSK